MSHIKYPLFVIAEDNTVQFFHESLEIDYCDIEPIDIADGVYTAYDSKGQLLKLVTIDEHGKINRPTEDRIKIPFLGTIIGVTYDRCIRALPTNIKNSNKLIQILKQDLHKLGRDIELEYIHY